MEEKNVERDFAQEVQELYDARPELKGEQLPEDVVKACAVDGKRLSDAYRDYADRKTAQQNETAARRAPVRSVTKGGSVEATPEDPFLRGFSQAW